MTVQDEVEEFIASMLTQGFTKAEIIEEIPEMFDGFDISLASDAYEDYENDNDPKNEEATVGDIERFIDELETEGFSHTEAIERAVKRFKLSAQEIRSMAERSGHKKTFSLKESGSIPRTYRTGDLLGHLDQVERLVLNIKESIGDSTEEMSKSEALELMRALVEDDGWDEEEAAEYVVDTGMMPDSDDAVANSRNIDQRDELVADLLDDFYELRMGR